jgi:hypothetical protein
MPLRQIETDLVDIGKEKETESANTWRIFSILEFGRGAKAGALPDWRHRPHERALRSGMEFLVPLLRTVGNRLVDTEFKFALLFYQHCNG